VLGFSHLSCIYNIGHVYIHIYNGVTEEEEERREKKERKKNEKKSQYTLGLFLQGEGYTESRGLIIFNPRGVFLPFHGERGCWLLGALRPRWIGVSGVRFLGGKRCSSRVDINVLPSIRSDSLIKH
jgi:hypothetical protein